VLIVAHSGSNGSSGGGDSGGGSGGGSSGGSDSYYKSVKQVFPISSLNEVSSSTFLLLIDYIAFILSMFDQMLIVHNLYVNKSQFLSNVKSVSHRFRFFVTLIFVFEN
jgi:hypothetical protein